MGVFVRVCVCVCVCVCNTQRGVIVLGVLVCVCVCFCIRFLIGCCFVCGGGETARQKDREEIENTSFLYFKTLHKSPEQGLNLSRS